MAAITHLKQKDVLVKECGMGTKSVLEPTPLTKRGDYWLAWNSLLPLPSSVTVGYLNVGGRTITGRQEH
jgi:hypothetical protein